MHKVGASLLLAPSMGLDGGWYERFPQINDDERRYGENLEPSCLAEAKVRLYLSDTTFWSTHD